VTGELEALERRGWEALASPDGAAFYEDVMADDGLMVFPGLVLDKRQTIRAMAAERPWTSFDLSDIRVITATSDSAVVTYRAKAIRAGSGPYDAFMTTVYARRDRRWRVVFHQQTPVGGR